MGFLVFAAKFVAIEEFLSQFESSNCDLERDSTVNNTFLWTSHYYYLWSDVNVTELRLPIE